MEKYYGAYEERYRRLEEAGGGTWGHRAEDDWLKGEISSWVHGENIARVMEFACGEGAGGAILKALGCIYTGADISPTALAKARALMGSDADLRLIDMVEECPGEEIFDGALDISGLHMLITDGHREKYLRNVYRCLKRGGTAFFLQESYRRDAYEGAVGSIKEWQEITGLDFSTPQPRMFGDREVMLKLLPARPRNEAGYRAEMENAGFKVEYVRELAESDFMPCSAAILVRKI